MKCDLIHRDGSPTNIVLNAQIKLTFGGIMSHSDNNPKTTPDALGLFDYGSKLVSVTEASELFNLSPTLIREAIVSGKLKAFRPGKQKWLIRINDMKRYINNQIKQETEFRSKKGTFVRKQTWESRHG